MSTAIDTNYWFVHSPESKTCTPASSTSVIEVAEKTVSGLSVSQALANDQDKKTG